jgi:hypothetical protein
MGAMGTVIPAFLKNVLPPDPGAIDANGQPAMAPQFSAQTAPPPAGPPPDVPQDVPRGIQDQFPQLPADNTPNPALQGPTKLHALLSILGQGALGAAAGASQRNFGAGFEQAEQLPFLRAMRQRQLQQADLQNQHLAAQTQMLTNTVQFTDPQGNHYQIPQGQLPAFLKTGITEAGKNQRQGAAISSKEGIAAQTNSTNLRKQGLIQDDSAPNGVRPLTYDEMSPNEQAVHDLKSSQADAASARADLERAKNDPNSPAYKAAYGRLQVAQQNANTATQRLGLEGMKFNADYLGTGPGGAALPGAQTTEAGTPIGIKVSNANKTPATRLNKGDLANNVVENIGNVTQIIQRRPDLFGKLAGRFTTVEQMIGTDDPDIAELGQRIHNIALASNGVHGVRGAGAVAQTEAQLLNHFRNGPQATQKALSTLGDSVKTFGAAQTFGNRPAPGPATPTGAGAKRQANNPHADLGFVPD